MQNFKRGPIVRKELHLHDKKLKALEERALLMRRDLMEMLIEAGSGHSAGPLGQADMFAALYFHILVHDPKRPNWADRDRFVLSCGHVVPIQYVALAHAGYFSKKLLGTLRKFNSPLQGHPEYGRLPGIETTSGPLGEGSSQAIGMAYAALMDEKPWRVYCMMSDGELEEGQTWEAMLFAGKNKLYNCTFIIDRNNIQIDGATEDILPLEPLADKFRAFNLHVVQCVGNDISDFVRAIREAHAVSEKPTVIIADTIPGYGVDFMEYNYLWHGTTPKPGAEANAALASLRTLGGRITSEHE
ncbi:MAG: Transketolase protein [uncultured bacterium]|nr:MAG: Transketolase protein [uncultured bacterium]HBD05123.1 transketolase [Candidatus Uhrbacteria bacterium]